MKTITFNVISAQKRSDRSIVLSRLVVVQKAIKVITKIAFQLSAPVGLTRKQKIDFIFANGNTEQKNEIRELLKNTPDLV